jgi:hypothetical protein
MKYLLNSIQFFCLLVKFRYTSRFDKIEIFYTYTDTDINRERNEKENSSDIIKLFHVKTIQKLKQREREREKYRNVRLA